MNKIISREQGFTLVELMIVVAIIGILAAIAIPNYQTYQAKARQGEAKIALSGIHTALQSFAAEQSSFTACLTGAGFGLNGSNKRYYTIGIDAAMGAAGGMCGPTNNLACTDAGWTPNGGGGFNVTMCTVNGVATAVADVAFGMGDTPNVFSANARIDNNTVLDSTELSMLDQGTLATAPPAAAVDNVSFVVGAIGGIAMSGMIRDTWTIDQNKNLVNGQSGL